MSDKNSLTILPKETHNGKETGLEMRIKSLLSRANTLPKGPGCYFMQGKHGEVLYVGKAKNLKNRVKSYFNESSKSAKTQVLVGHIYAFDFIVTQTELESFVLENNLIKEHKPKYNILLKDDKTYPYVAVDFGHPFPKLEYVRRPKRKKNIEFFGPFPVGTNISKILRVLTKAFKLRDCSNHEFSQRKTPCILYQMKQCSAPCVDYIPAENYKAEVNKSLKFFQDKSSVAAVMEELTTKMMGAAEHEDFEQAALLRDFIEELDEFNQHSYKQNVETLSDDHSDIISYYIGEEEVDISLYLIRQGNLIGHKNFHFLKDDFLEDIEVQILQGILQYYSQNNEVIAEKIIVDFNKEQANQLEESFKTIFGEGVKFKVLAKSSHNQALLKSAKKHAEESQAMRIKNQDSVYIGLNKLKELLNLRERPKSLECYDIAIWQGKSPTAAQIYFYEGKPDKTGYKHYHLEERPEGNNDFAMMREVFTRRLKHGNNPDVFIVDGGIQQVNTVSRVLDELEIKVPVIGIAKARDLRKSGFRGSEIKHSDERLVIQGRSNPYILSKCPSLMKIVVQMRDEAHRFSRRLHHKAEHKRVLKSWIDDVKGLNDESRRIILSHGKFSQNELMKFSKERLREEFKLEERYLSILFKFLNTSI